ncbi:MRC1 [Branchiostoma lanceolatum]|uniref:MRC1 protein n=1 Tax=Branchiostoma lanceolatum TaxID=7740 RepID=A0A8S4MP38_BRALA|nr:MRC1 [Branchiostoma lanceolatum]
MKERPVDFGRIMEKKWRKLETDGEHCRMKKKISPPVSMRRWNDANCGTSNGFICERPPQPSSAATANTTVTGNLSGRMERPYRNKCYRFYLSDDTEKTWRDARDFCRSLGTYIMSQLKGIRRTVWIGLFDNIDENQFYWTSGHPVTFTNWNDGEPNNWNSQDEDCVDMYTDQARAGLWNDAPCDHLRLFICQSYKDPSLPAQPDISTCPSGFVAWRDSCYKLTQTSQSWAQANDACSRGGTGAQVVSIYDIYEQSFVKSQFVQQAWIGLSDQQVAGEYRWFSGWPVHFTAWGFNEPSRADGEGCVAMAMNGTWDDTDCSLQLPALCEITTATPPPTAPPMFGRCPDDTWLAIGSYCFYMEYGLSNTDQTRKTWYEAEFECVSRGAHLASFHSSEETNAIISRQGTPVWIGMFRDTGVPYSAITDNSISPGSVATVQYCQTTAEILFRGNCYRFYDERLEAWAEARSICLLFGGDLASINSGAETQFLVTQVASKKADYFWIGLREYSFDGLYQWTDGSAYFFHNWISGEPNDLMGAEQCVEIRKGDGV